MIVLTLMIPTQMLPTLTCRTTQADDDQEHKNSQAARLAMHAGGTFRTPPAQCPNRRQLLDHKSKTSSPTIHTWDTLRTPAPEVGERFRPLPRLNDLPPTEPHARLVTEANQRRRGPTFNLPVHNQNQQYRTITFRPNNTPFFFTKKIRCSQV